MVSLTGEPHEIISILEDERLRVQKYSELGRQYTEAADLVNQFNSVFLRFSSYGTEDKTESIRVLKSCLDFICCVIPTLSDTLCLQPLIPRIVSMIEDSNIENIASEILSLLSGQDEIMGVLIMSEIQSAIHMTSDTNYITSLRNLSNRVQQSNNHQVSNTSGINHTINPSVSANSNLSHPTNPNHINTIKNTKNSGTLSFTLGDDVSSKSQINSKSDSNSNSIHGINDSKSIVKNRDYHNNNSYNNNNNASSSSSSSNRHMGNGNGDDNGIIDMKRSPFPSNDSIKSLDDEIEWTSNNTKVEVLKNGKESSVVYDNEKEDEKNNHNININTTNPIMAISTERTPSQPSVSPNVTSETTATTVSDAALYTPSPIQAARPLEISFLPESLAEQWFLAEESEDLSLVLEEIFLLYRTLDDSYRQKAKADVPKIVRQLQIDISAYEDFKTLVNALKLMDLLAKDHSDAFVSELQKLFPLLRRYMDDPRISVREYTLKVAGALVSRLPLSVTEHYILSGIEAKAAHPEVPLKLAALALLHASGSSPSDPHHNYHGLAGRIARTSATYLTSSSSSNSTVNNVIYDVLACALLLLGTDDMTENAVFSENLSPRFLQIVGSSLSQTAQREISSRASVPSTPSLLKDSVISSIASALFAARIPNNPVLAKKYDNNKGSSSNGQTNTQLSNNAIVSDPYEDHIQNDMMTSNSSTTDKMNSKFGGMEIFDSYNKNNGSNSSLGIDGVSIFGQTDDSSMNGISGDSNHIHTSNINMDANMFERYDKSDESESMHANDANMNMNMNMNANNQNYVDVEAISIRGRAPLGADVNLKTPIKKPPHHRLDGGQTQSITASAPARIRSKRFQYTSASPTASHTNANMNMNAMNDIDLGGSYEPSWTGDEIAKSTYDNSNNSYGNDTSSAFGEGGRSNPRLKVAMGSTWAMREDQKQKQGNNKNIAPTHSRNRSGRSTGMGQSFVLGDETSIPSMTTNNNIDTNNMNTTNMNISMTSPSVNSESLSVSSVGGSGNRMPFPANISYEEDAGLLPANRGDVRYSPLNWGADHIAGGDTASLSNSAISASSSPSIDRDKLKNLKVANKRSSSRVRSSSSTTTSASTTTTTTLTTGGYGSQSMQEEAETNNTAMATSTRSMESGNSNPPMKEDDKSGIFFNESSWNIDKGDSRSYSQVRTQIPPSSQSISGGYGTQNIPSSNTDTTSNANINNSVSTSTTPSSRPSRRIAELIKEGPQTPVAIGTYNDSGVRSNTLRKGSRQPRHSPYAAYGSDAPPMHSGSAGSTSVGTRKKRSPRVRAVSMSAEKDKNQRSDGMIQSHTADNAAASGTDYGYDKSDGMKMEMELTEGFSPKSGRREKGLKPSVADISLDQSFQDDTGISQDSAIKSETFDYLTPEDIHPSMQPKKDIEKAVYGVVNHDWPEIFHTLNSVRRLGLHHQQLLLSSGNLHNIVIGVIKQVENLRSAVAKNAILTLGDLCQGVPKGMDSEVNGVSAALVKRYADTSSFLGDSSEQALIQLIENLTPTRCLSALVNCHDNRNATVRGRVAGTIKELLNRRGSELAQSRELDVLIGRLPKLLSDQSPECRAHARSVVRYLLENKELGVRRDELERRIGAKEIEKSMRDSAFTMIGSGMRSPVRNMGAASPDTRAGRGGFSSSKKQSGSKTPLVSKSVNDVSNLSLDMTDVTTSEDRSADRGTRGMRNTAIRDAIVDKDGYNVARSLQFNDNINSIGNSNSNSNSKINEGLPSEYSNVDDYHDSSTALGVALGNAYGKVDVDVGLDGDANVTIKTNLNVDGKTNLDSDDGMSATPSPAPSPTRRMPGSSSPSKGRSSVSYNREIEDTPLLNNLTDTVAKLSKNSWNDRVDALTTITDAILQHDDTLKGSGKLDSLLDKMVEFLQDGSIKVSLHCISCIQRLQEEKPRLLHTNQPITLPALIAAASSTNKQLSRIAGDVTQKYINNFSSTQLLNSLTTIALHDKQNMRITAFNLLKQNVPKIHAGNDTHLKKQLFPVVSKVLFSTTTKGDVRVAAGECLKAIQTTVGSDNQVALWVKDYTQREEIKRLTSSVV